MKRAGGEAGDGRKDVNKRIPDPITPYLRFFKMDMLVMSIVILCILSTVLYQAIAVLEKRFL